MTWRKLLAVPAIISVMIFLPLKAVRAEIFSAYLPEIRQNLPPGFVMRLPAEIRLGGPADEDFIKQLIVRVFPSRQPAGMTVGLFTCRSSEHPCLVGSISVARQSSPDAVRELTEHQVTGETISLSPRVQGYLLIAAKPTSPVSFASMMWQQDGFIYTVTFLSEEWENIIWMAQSMVRERPIGKAEGRR